MMEYRKKFIALLVTAVIVGGILIICSAQSSNNQTQPDKPELAGGSLFSGDPNFPKSLGSGSGNQELFFRMMLSVLLVLALGVAAIYISRKVLPRITNLPGKEIRVIETVHLGQRKTIHLLKIGSRLLLVGSTNENITKLADVTDTGAPEADLSAQEIPISEIGMKGAARMQKSGFGGHGA